MEEDKLRLLKLYNMQDLNSTQKLFLLATKPKLYIYQVGTLNIDFILWHPQLIVDAVKC